MRTYHEVLAFLALVGLVWLLLTVLDWRCLLTSPRVLACATCGLSDPALGFDGDACPPCRARERQAEATRQEREWREYTAKVARWRARMDQRDEMWRAGAQAPAELDARIERDADAAMVRAIERHGRD